MSKTIKNIAIGLALLVSGAGITLPIAYNSGFNAGRESATPIIARDIIVDVEEEKDLGGLDVIDASGKTTSLQFTQTLIKTPNYVGLGTAYDGKVFVKKFRINGSNENYYQKNYSDLADSLEKRFNQ